MQAEHPLTMTTLATHDTKRADDVRARLAVMTEVPATMENCAAIVGLAGMRNSKRMVFRIAIQSIFFIRRWLARGLLRRSD